MATIDRQADVPPDTTASQIEILARIVVDDDEEMREALNRAYAVAEAFTPKLRPIVEAIKALRARGEVLNRTTLYDALCATPEGRADWLDFDALLSARLPNHEPADALVARVADVGLMRHARMGAVRLTSYIASPHATPSGIATRAADLAAQLTAYAAASADSEQSSRDAADALASLAPPVKPFPLAALPAPMRAYVAEAAEAIGAPLEYVAIPALASVSIALGASCEIEVKRGWRERSALWLAVVGATGTAKSPTQAAALRPLDDYQRRCTHEYEQAREAYEALEPEERHGQKPPMLEQVITTDATVEALADVLHRNPRGVLMVRDELAALVQSLDQYKAGRGADRSAYLSLWSSGASARLIVNRRSRDPLIIERPHLSIVGAIPPDILGELADERGREDGFIHRFLFAWPAPVRHRWSDVVIEDETLTAYDRLYRALLAITPSTGGADGADSSPAPHVVTLSEDARLLFTTFYDEIHEQLEAPALPTALRGPLAKMPGQAARLALTLHMCEFAWQGGSCAARLPPAPPVAAETMCAALALADYFVSHARRVYAQLATRPSDARAAAVLEWMRAHAMTSCTPRDLVRAGVAGIHTTEEARTLLSDLATTRRLGTLTRRPGPGPISEVFTLYQPNAQADDILPDN